ncbi:hypothetical protein [Promicromonospora sp. NPDC059942]|uniref:hypothetical protein n=1 Tax=Promicromonospora sp. NPDC059942 TaxID=3347009 RepID=UPI00365A084C
MVASSVLLRAHPGAGRRLVRKPTMADGGPRDLPRNGRPWSWLGSWRFMTA